MVAKPSPPVDIWVWEVGNVWASVEVVEWKYSIVIETKIGRGHQTLLNVTLCLNERGRESWIEWI